jgi:hypothetical protein
VISATPHSIRSKPHTVELKHRASGQGATDNFIRMQYVRIPAVLGLFQTAMHEMRDGSVLGTAAFAFTRKHCNWPDISGIPSVTATRRDALTHASACLLGFTP